MGTIREYKKEDGTLTYHAEVRLKGYSPQRESFRTRTLAKKWIQDTESSIRDGRHFRIAEAKKHTVKDLIDRFVSQWLSQFPERIVRQTAYLAWWKERLGHLLLADLTPAAIAEARDTLLSENTSRQKLRNPVTVNRYLAAFSRALTIAMKEWGWIDDTPMRKVSKPSEGSGRNRTLVIWLYLSLIFLFRRSLTIAGEAFPLHNFMTWPTRKSKARCLPALKSVTD